VYICSMSENSYHIPEGSGTTGKASPAVDERAKGLTRGWVQILKAHRCPRNVIDDCRRQLKNYLKVESTAIYFKRAKYIGVRYMAWYLKVEMPEVPDMDFVPSGAWKKWSKSRRHFNRSNTHLWYSILQAKRCALPLTEDMVLATYVKHRIAMSREDPIDEDTLESVFQQLIGVLEPVRRALTRAYQTNDDLEELQETSWAPSENAAYEASKMRGGQKQALRKEVTRRVRKEDEIKGSTSHSWKGEDFFSETAPFAPTSSRVLPELVRMQFFTKVVVGGRVRTNYVVEFYEFSHHQEVWDDFLTDAVLQYDTGRPLKCTIYGILEPLKVRVISKGEAVPYYASKELQKRLHGILRKMDCFRLLGRPLCPTDLMDCADNPVQTGGGSMKWFSVDYSSATDCLSASLSARILSYLVQDLPERMQELWLRVLAPHLCEYPPVKSDGTKVTVPPVMQKNGQLMGSPLSFPILCLANLGLYLEVIKDDPRSLKDKLAGVLINGDDMLYVAPESLWDRHREVGKTVGLEMTPGKAYMHKTFANMNSTCFHYDLEAAWRLIRRPSREVHYPVGETLLGDVIFQSVVLEPSAQISRQTPWQIDFLNTGLLFGQNKVLEKDTTVGETVVSHRASVINQLLKGALPGKQKGLLKGYLRRHAEAIREECAGRNLFISPSLGGLGVDAPPGWSWKITDRQRMTASVLAQRLGPYAEFGVGPARAPFLEQPVDKVHPFMRLVAPEKDSVHKSDFKIKANGTYLSSALLSQPVRLVRSYEPQWRRVFLRGTYVERSHTFQISNPHKRCQTDFFRELAGTLLVDMPEVSTGIFPPVEAVSSVASSVEL